MSECKRTPQQVGLMWKCTRQRYASFTGGIGTDISHFVNWVSGCPCRYQYFSHGYFPVNDLKCLTYSEPIDSTKPNLLLLPPVQGSQTFFVKQLDLSTSFNLFFGSYQHSSIRQNAKALVNAMPVERFLILGISFGGLVGWTAANLHPHKVSGLITLGTLPAKSFLRRRILLGGLLFRYLPSSLFTLWYHRKMEIILSREMFISQHVFQILSELPSKSVWYQRILAIAKEFPMDSPVVKTLWMWGENDPYVHWKAKDIALLQPNSKPVSLSGGHFANYSNPQIFKQELERFISNLTLF